VRYDDDGWCSAQLGGDIFNPYLEIEFGQDIIFHAVMTEGFSTGFLTFVFLERYQIEIAGEDEHFRYIASNATTNLQPAVSKAIGMCHEKCQFHHFLADLSYGSRQDH